MKFDNRHRSSNKLVYLMIYCFDISDYNIQIVDIKENIFRI